MPTVTLQELAEIFAHAAATLPAEVKEGLEKSAELIETTAKEEIGTYQGGAGPFGSWPELAEATQEERSKKGFSPDDPGLRTGQMRDGIQHKLVSDTEAAVGSDDDELLWFEVGTKHQPPRSVLGLAAVNKEEEICKLFTERMARLFRL